MTYTDLQTDIAGWLARDDLTVQIPGFIRLCEANLARDVRVQAMLRRAQATGDGTRYLSLPAGYLEMRRLRYNDNADLLQVTPEAFRTGSTLQSYCVHREIEFNTALADTDSVEMVYYAPLTALSNTAPENWILTNAYDAYLYGSLAQAEPYLRNDDRAVFWSNGYTSAVAAINENDRRGRVNRGGQALSLVGGGATP